MKEISLGSSVYELVTAYPEIQRILFDLGLKDIQTPGMLTTVGRYMTIPKGAKMKKNWFTSHYWSIGTIRLYH